MGVMDERGMRLLSDYELFYNNAKEGMAKKDEALKLGTAFEHLSAEFLSENEMYLIGETLLQSIKSLSAVLLDDNSYNDVTGFFNADFIEPSTLINMAKLYLSQKTLYELATQTLQLDAQEMNSEDLKIEYIYRMIDTEIANTSYGQEVDLTFTSSIAETAGYRIIDSATMRPEGRPNYPFCLIDSKTGEVVLRNYAVSQEVNESVDNQNNSDHDGSNNEEKTEKPQEKPDPKESAGASRILKDGVKIDLIVRISRNLSDVEKKQARRDIEQYLFKNGARYEKYTIPANESRTGKEINGKNWYVAYKEGMNLSVFGPYLKDKSILGNSVLESAQTEISGKSGVTEANKTADRKYLFLPPAPQAVFKDTIANLKAAGAKFDGETKRWYITSDIDEAKFSDFLQPYDDEPQPTADHSIEKSYCGKIYPKNDNIKTEYYFGSTPDAIITQLQGLNMHKDAADKYTVCYIAKLNTESNKYENSVKYDVASGMDITPRYLQLPSLGKNDYQKLISQLKNNGARFNPQKKQWYIDNRCDLNLFKEYLPIDGTTPTQAQADVAPNLDPAPAPAASPDQSIPHYTVEPGKEYYDNRIRLTIDGMEPVNLYGDDYNVHFPSMKTSDIDSLIVNEIIPSLDQTQILKEIPKSIEYNGQNYDSSQYNIIAMGIDADFSEKQMSYLEHPDIDSARLNEIRFGIMNGLNDNQMAVLTGQKFPWQMSMCLAGFSNDLPLSSFENLLKDDFNIDDGLELGARYNALNKLIHSAKKPSVISKVSENLQKMKELKSDDTSDKTVIKQDICK